MRVFRCAIQTFCLVWLGLTGLGVRAQQATPPAIDAAAYTAAGELEFPADTDRWIVVGTGLGGDYGEGVFDPANPGTLGVVQMEPSAYEALLSTGRYRDGSMLLLSFYSTLRNPEPALRGFVQGELVQREIHVIDRGRFPEEGRAFFVFPVDADGPAARLPLGSVCVQCHTEHADFDATFTQFYPRLRHLGSVPSE